LGDLGKAAVIGAGSWGTALAFCLGSKGIDVALWGRDADDLHSIESERENPTYLPGVKLPDSVKAEPDIAHALRGAAMAVEAVPSDGVADVSSRIKDQLEEGTTLVSATKGLEPEKGLRTTELFESLLGQDVAHRSVVLSGPNLAVEVVRGVPTASVAASEDAEAAELVQLAFASPAFRVYTNDDVKGVELAGALKNVIALAAGINDGLGFGDNTKAALVTRGLAEIVRLGVALGAREETFYGLAGVGDLFATCASKLSRNRTVGFGLGEGRLLDEVLQDMTQVAEGIPTTKAAVALARRCGVEMPITEQVYQVLFEGKSPKEAVAVLMGRELKPEARRPRE
jgi:glycerol-3-phosphate dehydrogenase (NAD(P)+)